jgi:hypothetical protein
LRFEIVMKDLNMPSPLISTLITIPQLLLK